MDSFKHGTFQTLPEDNANVYFEEIAEPAEN